MMNKDLMQLDQLDQQLTEAGFDLEDELMQIETKGHILEIPRIRVEHKDNGKHRLYIDYGENYLTEESQEESLKQNKIEAVVFAEQFIRALWEEEQSIPRCSSIDNIPISLEPFGHSCNICKESVIGPGKCKPKVRLWSLVTLNGQIKPVVMNLSPTSIKHWENHKRKLKRSKLPVVVVNTVFSLEDIKKNGYRWAEVNFDINGVTSKEMLKSAKQARDELNRLMEEITQKDFDEPGDKIEQ